MRFESRVLTDDDQDKFAKDATLVGGLQILTSG
jgi:hypothetical protein